MRPTKSSIISALFLIGSGLLWVIRILGDVDFVVNKTKDLGWMKGMVNFLLSPPDWFLGALFISGLLFAWYAIRLTRNQPELEKPASNAEHALEPDMELHQVIFYVVKVMFPNKHPNVGNMEIEDKPAITEITKKLRTGELTAWGRYVDESVERKFKKEDWEFREILLF